MIHFGVENSLDTTLYIFDFHFMMIRKPVTMHQPIFDFHVRNSNLNCLFQNIFSLFYFHLIFFLLYVEIFHSASLHINFDPFWLFLFSYVIYVCITMALDKSYLCMPDSNNIKCANVKVFYCSLFNFYIHVRLFFVRLTILFTLSSIYLFIRFLFVFVFTLSLIIFGGWKTHIANDKCEKYMLVSEINREKCTQQIKWI